MDYPYSLLIWMCYYDGPNCALTDMYVNILYASQQCTCVYKIKSRWHEAQTVIPSPCFCQSHLVILFPDKAYLPLNHSADTTVQFQHVTWPLVFMCWYALVNVGRNIIAVSMILSYRDSQRYELVVVANCWQRAK